MTKEQQRIAIAEACGWRHQKGEEPHYGGTFTPAAWFSPKGRRHISDWRCKSVAGLPDYLNDLNAMHEAEKTLTHKQTKEYLYFLQEVTSAVSIYQYNVTTATAAQRAEAFLKTIGKWTDD